MRSDMLSAVIQEFDLHTVMYIGEDEEFLNSLTQSVDRPLESPGDDDADVVFLDQYGDDPNQAIGIGFGKTKEGGFLMGSGYNHETKEIQYAVAEAFNLALVQIGPESVWCVRK